MQNNQRKLIIQHISTLNGSQFQDLCDSLLYQIFRDATLLLRKVGSHPTKDKTIQGTPDTFIRLNDGSILFVESTTTTEGKLYQKLRDDIMCCLSSKSPCQPSEISKIILCYNETFTEAMKLDRVAESYGITLDHYNPERIAEELVVNYPWIADQYFSTNICNGDVCSLDGFLDSYNHSAKKYSYPLTNVFKFREEEFTLIRASIVENPITIISGNTGVGKTRICTEVMRLLFEEHLYTPISVSRISEHTLPIIRQCTSNDECYILFVDDANTVDQISQLTQLLHNDGRIRILLTVKSFAYREIYEKFSEYQTEHVFLNDFTDEQIKSIITDAPFHINHYPIQSRIIELAQGNTRLAAMISEEILRAKSDAIFQDMKSMYDVFFDKVHGLLRECNENLKKVFCLVSLFRSMSINSAEYNLCINLLGVTGDEFGAILSELHKFDFVDFMESASGKSFKISDQMLAKYILYKYLFEEPLFRIEDLMSAFFSSHPSQIEASIFAVTEAYGFAAVEGKLHSAISACLVKESNNKIRERYVDSFSVFMPDEALSYYARTIKDKQKTEVVDYRTEPKLNEFSFRYDKMIYKLVQFLHHREEIQVKAFALLLEYCRRDTRHLVETVYWMRKEVIYPPEDITDDFSFSNSILDLLTRNIHKDELSAHLFLALAQDYLGFEFRQDRRKGRKLSMLMYTIKPNAQVEKFRFRVWQSIKELFDKYPQHTREVINHYACDSYRASKGIVESDIRVIWSFLIKNLKPKDLMDVVLLNRVHRLATKKKLAKKYIVPKRFDSVAYRFYKYMKYDLADYDYEYANCMEDKQKKLGKVANITSLRGIHTLASKIILLRDLVGEETFNTKFSNTITPIMLAVMSKNVQYSVELFFRLLHEMPKVFYLDRTYMFRMHQIGSLRLLEDGLYNYQGEYARNLQLDYLHLLESSEISNSDCTHLQNTIDGFQGKVSVELEKLHNYPNYNAIISSIAKANERDECQIVIDNSYFNDIATYFCGDVELAHKSYFQQSDFGRTSFDYNLEGLQSIFVLDKSVAQKYVKRYCMDKHDRTHQNFSFLFGKLYDFNTVATICDMISDANKDYIHYYDLSFGFLFRGLEKSCQANATDFLRMYYNTRKDDLDKLSLLFRAARNVSHSLYEELIVDFIDNLDNAKPFFQIDWWPRSGTFSGDTTMGDIEINRWRTLMPIINRTTNIFVQIEIDDKIQQIIQNAQTSRDNDRRRMFEEDAFN